MDRVFSHFRYMIFKCAVVVAVMTVGLVARVGAFEVLSEGAMGKVSAVSTDNVEDLINVNGPAAAGVEADTDYEKLPLDVSVSLEGEEAPDFTSELKQAVTKEVEAWADNLRERKGLDYITNEIPVIDDIGPELTPEQVSSVVNDVRLLRTPEDQEGRELEDTLYILRNSKNQVETETVASDHIIVSIQSQIDRVSDVNMRFTADSASLGSIYITGLKTNSVLDISAGPNRARMNDQILNAIGR